MRRIYLTVTASAVILTACTTGQDATPKDQTISQENVEQQHNNGQLNFQQINQNQEQYRNHYNKGTAIDADEHFLTDISKFYDNEKYENDHIHLFIDGMHLHTNPSAFIDGDEVYIPLSFISAHLEAGVRFDKDAGKVEILRGETNIELFLEENRATVNGVETDTPSFINSEGTIFVPICFVAEALGYSVEKNMEDDEVKIETHQPEAETFQFTAMEENEEVMEVQSIPAQAMNKETYTVQAGDSLFLIAKKFNTTVERLKELNGLSNDTIEKGQVLVVLARPSSYTVVAGDTLYSISKKFELTIDQIQRYNGLTSSVLKPGQQLTLIQPSSYTVKSGDTLYSIAKSFGTTVDNLTKWNSLHGNVIAIGQELKIVGEVVGKIPSPSPTTDKQTTYSVQAGDTLYSIAKRFNTTVDNISRWNNLNDNIIHLGQSLVIAGESKPVEEPPAQEKQPEPTGQQKTYTVTKGDTLLGIAKRFNTTVEDIKRLNNLRNDDLQIGRTLVVVGSGEATTKDQQGVTVSFKTHTVKSGDNLWNLSVQYGIPMLELAKENNLSVNSSLSIGQKLTVPVYNVPVKSTVSSNHGELLDWWTEARYVFPIGTVATVKDVKTGRTFKVKHTAGGNHADAEPMTASDAKIMKEVWGGNYSWTPRAIILTVNGRQLAAAMHSYPHSIYDIKDNGYNGHFCIHFLNSTRHNDGLIQDSMQKQIKISAGIQ